MKVVNVSAMMVLVEKTVKKFIHNVILKNIVVGEGRHVDMILVMVVYVTVLKDGRVINVKFLKLNVQKKGVIITENLNKEGYHPNPETNRTEECLCECDSILLVINVRH